MGEVVPFTTKAQYEATQKALSDAISFDETISFGEKSPELFLVDIEIDIVDRRCMRFVFNRLPTATETKFMAELIRRNLAVKV